MFNVWIMLGHREHLGPAGHVFGRVSGAHLAASHRRGRSRICRGDKVGFERDSLFLSYFEFCEIYCVKIVFLIFFLF